MEAATATATHPPLDDDMALRVRQTIDVTRGVAKYLKHAIILPVALTGCGLMICGMYVWLGTLCVLRWLLLMTVALLRECLELPDSDVLSARANTVPSGRSTGHAVTAGSGERVAQERLKQTLESQSQHTAVDTVYGGNVKRVDSPLGDHDETSEQAPRRRLEANWDLKPVDMGVEPKSDWEDETRHEVAFKPMNISPGWDLISHRGAAAHTMDGLDTTADWKTRAPGRTRPTPPQVETSAEKQSNWLVSMSAGPLTSEPTHEVRVNTYRVDSSVPGIAGENGKPTVYTAEQLAEATNFIREVAKGGHARKTSCTQKASPAKPVPPVTYRQVATPSRTPKAPLPSSRRPWPAVPSAPQQATVSAANPKDNVPPPHVRAQQAALAKRSSGNDTKQDPTAPVKARGPAVRVAGPNMYDVLQVESPTASVPSTPSKPATTQVDAAAESKSVIERSKHPTEDMPTPPSVLAIQATEMQEDTPVSPSQTATVPTALDPQRGEHGCVAESESTADAVELQAAREQTERGMKGSLAAVPQASSRGASLSGREDSSSSSGFHGDDLLDLDRESPPAPVAPSLCSRTYSDLRATALPFVAQQTVHQPIATNSVSTAPAEHTSPTSTAPQPYQQAPLPTGWASAWSGCRDQIGSLTPRSMPPYTQRSPGVSENLSANSFPVFPGEKASKTAPPGLGVAQSSSQLSFDDLLAGESRPDPQSTHGHCQEDSSSAPPPSPPLQAVQIEAPGAATEPEQVADYAGEPSSSANGTASAPASRSSSASNPRSKSIMSRWELKMLKDATRKELARAWWGREGVRKKLLGTWSLEGQQALEAATLAYSEQRAALQDIMSGGKLNAEDASTFPELSSRDLAMPKVRPPFIPAEGLRKEGEAEPKGKEAEEESGENKRWADHFKKTELALGLYHDACADFKRPQSQGRKYPRYGVATGKAKMVRAKNYYRKRREMFEAAFPDHAMLITAFPAVDALE